MSEDLIVETRQGRLRGAMVKARGAEVRRWLGAPYAQARRFAEAEPPSAWAGVRDATSMAPQCPQGMGKRIMVDAPGYGEDCLALNIWSPPGAEDGRPRPVLFWIHGGAFMAGSCNPYDGAELAAQGDMIVVAINYRVGVFGFVNFAEALGLPEIPSNLGLRDQIAALHWVHDNIAAFGGDPERVTICGQSAGSMSVSLLMLCEEAWPLFRGAIMQSGAVSLIHDREMSLKLARRYCELLDLNQGGLEKLRTIDARRLLEAQALAQQVAPLTIPAAPWYDGAFLPPTLEDAHRAASAPVPLMAGSTREETRLFEMLPGPDILPTKRADLETIVRAQLPSAHADQVLNAYGKNKAGARALATDLAFTMPTRNFAERHSGRQPTWFYRFDYSHPLAGAAHGIDLLFMWPIYGLAGMALRGGLYAGRLRALAERYRAHIIRFVQSGRPGEDWPAYAAPTRATLAFNLTDKIEHDPDRERRTAWLGKDVGPGISARV